MCRRSVVIASIVGLSACKDIDTKAVDDDVCTPLPKEPCDPPTSTGTSDTGGDDTGGDDTGGGEAGGPEKLGPDECVHNVTDGVIGYRMQCEGKLFTTLKFELPLGHDCESTLGVEFCSQYHAFGPSNDTYEAPDVMACCGEAWDYQYGDIYLEHCTYDLIQQVCISMTKRLESYILDGAFATHSGQAAALQVWVAENYKECFKKLRQNDSNPDPAALESSWKIPNSPAWGAIDDMVLSINAGTESTGVIRPESPLDWILCNGANGNNDEIFKDTTTPNGGIVAGVNLSANVLGELVGPTIFGGTVDASTTFGTSCLPHGCPTATFSYDVDKPAFTLEELSLYTQSFDITNGVAWLTVERARIELWGQAVGTANHDPDGRLIGSVIPAGEARFLLAGAADGRHNQFVGSNVTDIEISVVDEVWFARSFVIAYEDGSGRNWSLTLGESRWQ